MSLPIRLLGAMLLISAVPCLSDTVYYVDSLVGNDTFSGKLPDLNAQRTDGPWKSLKKVADSSKNFLPGDTIRFRRGQTFYTFFNAVLQSNGSQFKPITYTSYGDPGLSRPVLTNSKDIRTEASKWAAVADRPGIYTYAYEGCYVQQIWENGVPLRRATTSALIDGRWYFPRFSTHGDCLAAQVSGVIKMYYAPSAGAPELQQSLDFANNNFILGIPNRSFLTFDDLAFRHSLNAIYARGKDAPVHNIVFSNNLIEGVLAGIKLHSVTVDGVVQELRDIEIRDNEFKNIRFAVLEQAIEINNGSETADGTTPARSLRVIGNKVRDIAKDGAYTLDDTNPDIEVFSFQNLRDSVISDNDVRDGLKIKQGLLSAKGAPLASGGAVLWVNPKQTIENIRISRNRFDNLGKAITMGAGPNYHLVNVIIDNNIISNSENGIRLNSGDSSQASGVFHNTLYANDISIHLNSGAKNYQIKNNLNVDARKYHVWVQESGGFTSVLDHNVYVSDAPTFHYDDGGNATGKVDLIGLASWQEYAKNQDLKSNAVVSAGFVDATPVEAEDFKLIKTSFAVDAGAFITTVTDD